MCNFQTNTIIKLENHMKAKHDKMRLKCEECHFKTLSEKALEFHISQKHNENRTIQCEFCEFSTTKNWALKRHNLLKHIPEENKKEYKCDKCDFNTYIKHQLQDHKRKNHIYISISQKLSKICLKIDETNYKCQTCQQTFPKQYKCERHIKVEHLGLNILDPCRTVICYLCNIEVTKTSYRRHLRRKHDENKECKNN